jgi:hypothetical protein
MNTLLPHLISSLEHVFGGIKAKEAPERQVNRNVEKEKGSAVPLWKSGVTGRGINPASCIWGSSPLYCRGQSLALELAFCSFLERVISSALNRHFYTLFTHLLRTKDKG